MREANSRQATSVAMSWPDAQPRFVSPCFDAVRARLNELELGVWPTVEELNRLAVHHRLDNQAGLPIRFVTPGDDEADAVHYETRIAQSGFVATHESWHDLFNALQWLSFPQSKAVISAAHARLLATRGEHESKVRSVPRDVLTLFDEGGLIICSTDTVLLGLVREFKWRELFVERRAAVLANMRFYLAGHSALEKMLAPFVGITAKAMLVEVDSALLRQTPEAQVEHLDAVAARWLQDDVNLASTRNLHPVPILGVPGWDLRNESPQFYADRQYFRAGYTRDAKR